MQPLKIKSPQLMLLSLFANLFIIVSVSVIQISEELCVNAGNIEDSGVCSYGILEVLAISFGYILIGFTEPLAIVSYVLRAFRLRSIYDAQLTYFREERKPVEMIEKFREMRLIKITALSVGPITITYLILALLLAFVPTGQTSLLYLLPSVDTSSFAEGSHDIEQTVAQENFNQGMTNSLYFLIFYSFGEGILFLVAMHRVRHFNEDFNLLDEIKRYAIFWLVFTNLILWLMVQGSYAGFLSLLQLNRYKTVLYILRSVVAVTICAMPPLRESYKEASFFPIPPNRESIETVDMVLHIPVAIDFFYDYLKNRHNPDGIHFFALYIDLRLWDSICLNPDCDLSEIVEMAQKIKMEYLDEGAEYEVDIGAY